MNETNLESDVGSNATFVCKSQEVAQWFFNDIRIYGSINYLIQHSTLVIKNVKLQHYGLYSCYGTYENQVNYFYTHASLKVYGKSTQNHFRKIFFLLL